jgi:hypothetical protein
MFSKRDILAGAAAAAFGATAILPGPAAAVPIGADPDAELVALGEEATGALRAQV